MFSVTENFTLAFPFAPLVVDALHQASPFWVVAMLKVQSSFVVNEIDFSNKGSYEIFVQSKDSTGNTSYKKIEVIVYDDFEINFFYYLFIIISLGVIIIIYIFRFKKSRKF